ncbi:non-ribosomal peptide synthetase [Pyxidicoccus sp. MSG2]|uniref:non-ribosomal peptide synthetase n=1 Tax=Pyxidicoccus sp. MSG2 TaxID=2996790 RepID=UPI00227215F8|nr:non-ribosomal peptide synthetase [Pyxidicoccus sp. MSG2]MCY1022330.1 amino acid adenylation domain-containing protein [Pyxidicoccus sp. MSG2]
MSQHERAPESQGAKPEALPGRKRPPLVPVSRTEMLPLSFMQQRLWFLAQLEGSAATYNVHFFVRLKGPLDVPALRRAVADVVQRHEALRTTFSEVNGQPVQRTTPELALPVSVEELEPRPGEAREEAVRRRAEEEARHPFDLEAGPLVRATLLRVSDEDQVLLFVTHHIVCDAVSFYWMASELNTLYLAHSRGEEPRLPALPVQYADFAHWQREWLQGEALEAQRAWWTERLAGAPPVLELPTDRPHPPAQTFRGVILPVPLPATLPAAVRELARKAGVTPYMAMLAGFGALLSRYSGQSDLVVGTPFAGRGRREVEKLIGFFANTLALRLDASGELSFLELLRRTREGCLGAFARPDMPFEQLVDALVPVRDASRSPLFQVMFVHVSTPLAVLKWPGVTVEEVAYEPGVARFDITLFFYEDPGGWVCRWEYNRDLFDEATILRMAAHYTRLLEAACANPMETLSRLPLLTEVERHQVLREWNDTAVPYPALRTVHALFEAQAARQPDAIAASFADARLSYGELNRRANQLAHHLRSLGVGPDERVGICVERSLHLPLAVLATLKAGGAYVPLDPAYPAERLAAMLEVSGARVLLTQRHLQHVLPSNTATSLILDDADAFSLSPETDPAPTAGPDSLTYVIFTSGSTGAPKGVAMHHASLVNLIHFQRQSSSVPSGRTLQFSAFSFDVSFQEMLATWAGGGELVLISEEVRRDAHALLELMDVRGVERMFLPFVALQNLAEVSEQDGLVPRHLKEIITAGEQLRITPALRLLMQRLPGAVLHNQYGPTETHLATHFVLSGDPEPWPDLPLIGTPIANASIHLLDSHLQPVPVGVPGELYIGGLQVARGYWGRPDLTVERFIPDPFGTRPGARMYRTGDQARYRADGAIEFLGRRDTQVKVRGFRIELGEIEATLAKHPAVRDCVVAAREQGPGEKRLVAWVVGVEGEAPETDALKAFLKERLPEYMVPTAWVHLDVLPLTPSGKVDRKALPDPGQETLVAYVAPRTPTEALVADIWAPLLKLPRVGANDHFFERGGHSLLATQVASRLRAALSVEFPVRVLFEAPTVAELAERLDAMPRGTTAARPPPLEPTPRDGELPLSFSQQRLWFIAQLDAGGFSYNVPFVFRLEGRLDVVALEQGLRELTRRHEVLRTTFVQVEGRPVQRIAPEPVLRLAVEDVAALPDDARQATLARRAREEAQRPFDLAVGPLVRATLLRAAEGEHVLLLVMHHIVCDGWSLGVLLRELKALYTAALAGEAPSLAPLPVQYADFARWQRDWLRGEVLDAQLSWWKGQLAGAPSLLELPTDRPRPPVQGFKGALMQVPLPEALSDSIRELCRSEDVTPFMLLLASFHALLARYSGQPDIVVGTPIAGRTQRELEDLVGFFVNTLALRLDASGDPSFREWLRRVRETSLGAFAHQDVPFEKLVDAVQPVRDLSRSPLFQVMFVLQDAPPRVTLPGLSLGLLDIDPGVATFDLTLYMRETARGWMGFWEYNSDLFDEATVAGMAAHHARLLEAACAEPARRLSSLPLLTEAERRRMLAAWNAPGTEVPGESCLHALFEAQAARTPDAVALDSEVGRLTYGGLNARANQLAHHLLRRGVRVGDIVGVLLERSLDAMVALLGVLKTGAAYLPLDPAYPRERLEYMLADSGATRLLTHAGVLARTGALDVEVLDVEADRAEVAREADTNPGRAVPAASLAYLIYTSGSTGRPKAVMTPHRAVSAYALGNARIYGLTATDRVLQFSTLSFDQSVEEIFPALLTGGTVVLRTEAMLDPAAFCARCEQWGLTVLFLPTAFWAELTASMTSGVVRLPPSVRVVGIGGEKVPASRVLDWQRAAPAHVRLTNEYGPTETTVICVVGDLGPVPEKDLQQGRVPIGQAAPGVRACVLDAQLQPVPTGLPGELYVGGIVLAHGYLGRPDLTAERFVPDPFSTEPGARLYRTGDLVRQRPDGNLEYVGRADDQVKLRGFRIELGEIESALRKHAGVRDVAVVVREPTPGDKRLVAYVVPDAGAEVRTSVLRSELKTTLPEYMVPSAFVLLDALPLTPSGKVDRKALPAPQEEAGREGYVAPRAGLEEVVADIWAPLLGVRRVGAHDNFFELGGHSLLATQVVSRLREVLQRELPVRVLFEAPTIAELARRIESTRDDAGPPPPPLVPGLATSRCRYPSRSSGCGSSRAWMRAGSPTTSPSSCG